MKCRQCKLKFQSDTAVYQWVYYYCSTKCRYEHSKWTPSIQTKNISPWRKALFMDDTKVHMLIRDKRCVIEWCNAGISSFHHPWFWAEAQYDEWRNDIDRGVGLCKEHHHEIHHGTKWIWKNLNEQCKKYLQNVVTYFNKK